MIVDIPCTSVRLSKWGPVTDSSDESIGKFIGIAGSLRPVVIRVIATSWKWNTG